MASNVSSPPALSEPSHTNNADADKSSKASISTIDKKGLGSPSGVSNTDVVTENSRTAGFASLFFRRFHKPIDLDSTATKISVYDDPDLTPHYWPKKDYENIHRFDPNARWTYREEQVSNFWAKYSLCST